MEFIFCGYYINTDRDFKQVKHVIYKSVLVFHGFNECSGYEDWDSHLEHSSIILSRFQNRNIIMLN